MDKKKPHSNNQDDDLRGFHEFIEGQSDQNVTLKAHKKDLTHEQVTFLTNDSLRLTKIKNLLTSKLPFATQYNQGEVLIKKAREEASITKQKLFNLFSRPDSGYQKSISAIFDSYFNNKNS